jgi:trans-2,3-dihydro-3-hydroxyanthranilate isomerase
MRTVQIALVDAFTDVPLRGNPAGVVLDAAGLDEDVRLLVSREVGASETVFVESLDDGVSDYRTRFYTPTSEVDLCGHATIAAFHHLAERGLVTWEGESTRLVQETRVGSLGVELRRREGTTPLVIMDQRPPTFEHADLSLDKLAAMFGIGKAQVDDRHPIQIVSTGIRSLHIPLKSISHFPDIKLLRKNVADLCRDCELATVQLFTLETEDPEAHAHARVFAPALGVDEDPVTGTAAGALGAYLVKNRVLAATEDTTRIVVEQGSEIGRRGLDPGRGRPRGGRDNGSPRRRDRGDRLPGRAPDRVAVAGPVTLALETSGSVGSVALRRPDGRTTEEVFAEGTTHGTGLLPACRTLLEEGGVPVADLALVAVSHGPGSFTGLRVGVSAAKALAFSLGAELVGVSTLDVLAENAAEELAGGLVVPVLDARRGHVHAALYSGGPDGIIRRSEDLVLPPDRLTPMLESPCTLLGDGVRRYPELATGRRVLPEDRWRARASVVARLAVAIHAAEGGHSIHELEPQYRRISTPEERRLERDPGDSEG